MHSLNPTCKHVGLKMGGLCKVETSLICNKDVQSQLRRPSQDHAVGENFGSFPLCLCIALG